MLPLYALLSAIDTDCRSRPVPAEMSSASFMISCDFDTSPVARTSCASAGRRVSSATPEARCSLSIQSSVAPICAVVECVTDCSVLSSAADDF